MLDKETLTRQKNSLPDEERPIKNFLCCIERVKKMDQCNDNLEACAERILEMVEKEE